MLQTANCQEYIRNKKFETKVNLNKKLKRCKMLLIRHRLYALALLFSLTILLEILVSTEFVVKMFLFVVTILMFDLIWQVWRLIKMLDQAVTKREMPALIFVLNYIQGYVYCSDGEVFYGFNGPNLVCIDLNGDLMVFSDLTETYAQLVANLQYSGVVELVTKRELKKRIGVAKWSIPNI